MTPVISPWVFYFMSVSNSLTFTSAVVFWITILVGAIFVIICWVNCMEGDEFQEKAKPFVKVSLLILIISGLISSLIPSENTITKMLIAQNVTYERVEMATDTVETVYNDIMELFEDSNG